MSELLAAVLKAVASESERLRAAFAELPAAASPATIRNLTTRATPPEGGMVDAKNFVLDPQHLGSGTSWEVAGGLKTVEDGAFPMGWRRRVSAIANGVAALRLSAFGTVEETKRHYWMLLTRVQAPDGTPYPAGVTVRLVDVVSGGVVDTHAFGQGTLGDWTRVGGRALLTIGREYRIDVVLNDVPVADTRIDVTGATLAAIARQPHRQGSASARPPVADVVDGFRYLALDTGVMSVVSHDEWSEVVVGECFSGDSPTDQNFSYDWQGAAWDSPSQRRGQEWDVIALNERVRGLNVEPVGLSLEQRSASFQARMRARHQPFGSTFVDLIVGLIQLDDPNFTSNSVRVIEDFEDYSFTLDIAYNPNGVLQDRLAALIEDAHPAHLRYGGAEFSRFLAAPTLGVSRTSAVTNLPSAVVAVDDASSFSASGQFHIHDGTDSSGLITYTGKTAASLTGCAGGVGNWAAGSYVEEIDPFYGEAGKTI